MIYKFTTKYKNNIIADAKEDSRPRANFVRKIVFDHLYTFNDEEIRGGKKPKVKHNVEIEGISLNEDELKLLDSIAKNYEMSAMKLVAFIMNQYYEGKENEQ